MISKKFSKYFLPGLKRWIFLLIFGIIFIVFGLALLLELRPLTQISHMIWYTIRFVAEMIPPKISGPLFLCFGIVFISVSIILAILTILNATLKGRGNGLSDRPLAQSILQSLERASKKGQGPKIVALGGGTGLSTLLRGIKNYSSNIIAIVTVGDDGGSSGRLREELKVVPPGDIRNCIVALTDEEEIITSLFQYRFEEGSLKGHSFGNLFLAALSELCQGDMAKASQVASRILRTGGQVLPSSLEAVCLCAEYEDGSIIEGESKIPFINKKIKKIFAKNQAKVLPDTIATIKDADLIILGPGSLYTSIIPNLLFPEIVNALKETKAKKIFICNLTQDKETKDYDLTDFIQALYQEGDFNLNAILMNEYSSWQKNNKAIQTGDINIIQNLGIELIIRPKLFDIKTNRHSSIRLSRAIMHWFLSNSSQNTLKK